MAEPYNLSIATSGNNLLGFMQSANTYTDNTFGVLMLVAIWVIVFLRLKVYETKAAMFVASFITSLVAMMFIFMSLVSLNIFLICVILTATVAALGKADE
jgi:hypothetical protein